jgi:hypothetical protein
MAKLRYGGSLCFLLLAALTQTCGSVEAQVTPITKVLQLMDGLLASVKKGKAEEKVKFAKFDTWCAGQKKTKDEEKKQGKEAIAKLTADIEKGRVLIKGTDSRIKELEEDVGRWTSDQKASSDVRSKEKADYQATVKSYGESIDALGRAIEIVKKQDFTRAQAKLLQESLLQVQSHRNHEAPPMPAELVSALTSLTQESESSDESSDSSSEDGLSDSVEDSLAASTQALTQMNEADEDSLNEQSQKPAAGYEFQSGGIVDMLGKLKTQFTGEKTKLEKEEANAQAAFEKIMQSLTSNLDGAKTEIAAKNKLLAKTQQAKAENEGNKQGAEKEFEEDSKYLQETTAMCEVKTSDFTSRLKLRDEEISTLSKAIEIIKGDSVAGAGKRNLDFIQVHSLHRRVTTFAHLRSVPQNPLQDRMAVFLSDRARSLGSTLLLDIAQRVQADPFKKVKKMVKDMIVKLMEEAAAETEKKGWCDKELTVNAMTREKKTDDSEELSEDMTELTADITKLAQDNADLTKQIAELDTAMMSETGERMKAKKANLATIKEAKAAIDAISKAMGFLKDFYASSAESTAFVQANLKDDDAPETFDEPYKGDQEGGAGVIGLLEVILSDFTKLESETTSSEALEEDAYKAYMLESAMDRAMKANAINLKDGTKNDKEVALRAAKEDLKNTKDALDKAIKYYEKLKPDCVDSGVSYAERVKRRAAEIQSLQEALKILS